MTDDWTIRVEGFWARFDDTDAPRMLSDMRALVDERPEDDALALSEWGGVHDALGLEKDAVGPYRRSLEIGP